MLAPSGQPRVRQHDRLALRRVVPERGGQDTARCAAPDDRGRHGVPEDQVTPDGFLHDESRWILDRHDRDRSDPGRDAAGGQVERGQESHARIVQVERIAGVRETQFCKDRVAGRREQHVAARRIHEDQARDRFRPEARAVQRVSYRASRERGHRGVPDPVSCADAGPARHLLRRPSEARERHQVLGRDAAVRNAARGSQQRCLDHRRTCLARFTR